MDSKGLTPFLSKYSTWKSSKNSNECRILDIYFQRKLYFLIKRKDQGTILGTKNTLR